MELDITFEVWQKGSWFIAKCPELDFISLGRTRDEARSNLLEVIGIQLEEMRELDSLDEYLAECGYEKTDTTFIPRTEMVGLEKHSVRIA